MSDTYVLDSEIIANGDIKIMSDKIDWGLIDVSIPKLWEKTRGENISVMVIDTGITNHPDLNKNIIWDKCISVIPNEDYVDVLGHGILVAGVISAQETGYGIVGVAPKSKIIAVKVFNKDGRSSQKSIRDALIYAKQVKPDIINMSLGSRNKYSPEIEQLLKDLYNMNIPIVCAMGNSGQNYSCYPANYSETIGVTSYKKNREISHFSSRGVNADFALPGEDILTTNKDNKYSIVKGTSFSAPFLSGIIALILSNAKKNNIGYSVEGLKNLLIQHTIDVGPKGKDELYGYGIINASSLNNIIK